jgi:hypothetical protein
MPYTDKAVDCCHRCESGRQDSNLRPLVPQISPHFPMRAEFDLEWFHREMVGMTTSPGVMESAGIAEKYPNAPRQRPPPISRQTVALGAAEPPL